MAESNEILNLSAINLGVGLARHGKRVLIIDNDPQGSCTAALGYQEPDKIKITLATIMERVLNEEEFDLMDGILHNNEGVDLMPANIELAGVETALIGILSSETLLKEYIELVEFRYDYVIIDCSPNLGQLTLNALTCADEVIIPVQAAYLPVKGLEQLLKTISRVRKKMNQKLEIKGILITMVDYRTNYAKEIREVLYSVYGQNIHIFERGIPMSVRAAEASLSGPLRTVVEKFIADCESTGNIDIAFDYMKESVDNRQLQTIFINLKNCMHYQANYEEVLAQMMGQVAAGLSAREDRKNILFSMKMTLIVISITAFAIVWIIGVGLGIDVKGSMTGNIAGQALLCVTGFLYLLVGTKMFGTDR